MGTSKSSQATEFSNAVNSEIRALMGRRGISQTRLAELTGMSQAKISKTIRNNQGSLTLDQLEAICSALKVSPTGVIDRAERAVLAQQAEAEASRPDRQNTFALAANPERRPEEDAQEADYF